MSRRKGTPLKTKTIIQLIAGCAFVCLAGLGYVWLKMEVYALNKQIKTHEVRVDELRRENAALARKHAGLCTPRVLDARVRELQLGLGPPQPDQIIRMPEPHPGAEGAGRPPVYAKMD